MPGLGSRGDDEADRVVYSLGSSPAERDRLRRQSGELRDHRALLLDRVGVAEGWRATQIFFSAQTMRYASTSVTTTR